MAKSALLSTMTPDYSITTSLDIENTVDAKSLPYRTDGVGWYSYPRTIPAFAYPASMCPFSWIHKENAKNSPKGTEK